MAAPAANPCVAVTPGVRIWSSGFLMSPRPPMIRTAKTAASMKSEPSRSSLGFSAEQKYTQSTFIPTISKPRYIHCTGAVIYIRAIYCVSARSSRHEGTGTLVGRRQWVKILGFLCDLLLGIILNYIRGYPYIF